MASVEDHISEALERVVVSEDESRRLYRLRELICECKGEATCFECKFIFDAKYRLKIEMLGKDTDLKVYTFWIEGDEEEEKFSAATNTWEGAKELFLNWLSLDRGMNARIKKGTVEWERMETVNGAFDCYLFRYKFGPGREEHTYRSFVNDMIEAKKEFFAYFHNKYFDADDKSYAENLAEIKKKEAMKRLAIKWS